MSDAVLGRWTTHVATRCNDALYKRVLGGSPHRLGARY